MHDRFWSQHYRYKLSRLAWNNTFHLMWILQETVPRFHMTNNSSYQTGYVYWHKPRDDGHGYESNGDHCALGRSRGHVSGRRYRVIRCTFQLQQTNCSWLILSVHHRTAISTRANGMWGSGFETFGKRKTRTFGRWTLVWVLEAWVNWVKRWRRREHKCRV